MKKLISVLLVVATMLSMFALALPAASAASYSVCTNASGTKLTPKLVNGVEWVENSGKLYMPRTVENSFLLFNDTLANKRVEATFVDPEAGGEDGNKRNGIVFALTDHSGNLTNSDYGSANMSYYWAFVNDWNTVCVFKMAAKQGEGWKLIGSDVAVDVNTIKSGITLAAEWDNSGNIKVYANGQLTHTIKDTNPLTGSYYGLLSNDWDNLNAPAQCNAYFTSFKAGTASATTPTAPTSYANCKSASGSLLGPHFVNNVYWTLNSNKLYLPTTAADGFLLFDDTLANKRIETTIVINDTKYGTENGGDDNKRNGMVFALTDHDGDGSFTDGTDVSYYWVFVGDWNNLCLVKMGKYQPWTWLHNDVGLEGLGIDVTEGVKLAAEWDDQGNIKVYANDQLVINVKDTQNPLTGKYYGLRAVKHWNHAADSSLANSYYTSFVAGGASASVPSSYSNCKNAAGNLLTPKFVNDVYWTLDSGKLYLPSNLGGGFLLFKDTLANNRIDATFFDKNCAGTNGDKRNGIVFALKDIDGDLKFDDMFTGDDLTFYWAFVNDWGCLYVYEMGKNAESNWSNVNVAEASGAPEYVGLSDLGIDVKDGVTLSAEWDAQGNIKVFANDILAYDFKDSTPLTGDYYGMFVYDWELAVRQSYFTSFVAGKDLHPVAPPPAKPDSYDNCKTATGTLLTPYFVNNVYWTLEGGKLKMPAGYEHSFLLFKDTLAANRIEATIIVNDNIGGDPGDGNHRNGIVFALTDHSGDLSFGYSDTDVSYYWAFINDWGCVEVAEMGKYQNWSWLSTQPADLSALGIDITEGVTLAAEWDAQGNIRVYANGYLVQEVKDDSPLTGEYYGLLTNFWGNTQTPNTYNAPVTSFVAGRTFTNLNKEVSFGGNVTLDGKTLTDGAFTFEIYAADAEFAIGGTPLKTATNASGKYTLKLSYTAADAGKTFYYVVKQKNGGQGGMKYDSTEYMITVTLLKNNNGVEVKTTVEGGTATNALSFKNTYAASGEVTVDLSGKVTYTGSTLKAGDFTFEIYSANASFAAGNKIESKTNAADGSFAFTTLKYTSVGTYYYVVKQINGGKGGITYDATEYKITVKVEDNGNGGLKATVSGATVNALNFANSYAVSGEATVDLSGKVAYTGGTTLKADDFVFELYAANASFALGDKVEAKANAADGSFAFTTLKYTSVGTYYYVVKQINGGKGGITYDATEYKITVKVEDNGNGGLKVTVSGVTANALNFANTYAVSDSASAKVDLSGKVTYAGGTLKAEDFVFELYSANASFVVGDKIAAKANGADGSFAFSTITYGKADIGTHYYVVKQINGGKSGITYDATEYKITVKVEDDGKGGIKTTVSGATVNALNFANSYAITGGAKVELSGSVTLTGKDITDGMFTIELYTTDASFVLGGTPKTTTNASGKFTFTLNYAASDAGKTFYYVVKEVKGGTTVEGTTYSSATYKITVKVEDDGKGGLKATVSGATANALNFENSYKTADGVSAKVDLSGKVTLSGKTLADGMFTFELYTADASFATSGTPKTITNTNGNFALTLNYASADTGKTFYYVLKEAKAGTTVDGITYSSTTYRITVKVESDGKGGITATATVKGDTALSALDFVNSYAVKDDASAKVDLSGKVTYTGLKAGDFEFELYTANASFVASSKIEAKKNAADGKFAFTTLTYGKTDIGTHYYVVKQVNGGKGGVDYDATEYKITVKVEDDGKGGIKVTVSGAATDALNFTNGYKTDSDASAKVELGGNVTFTGKDLVDGEFTFELYTADANFTVSGAPTTKTNVSGKFTFTLNYVASDAGKTFYYVVKEAKGGTTVDGITYSSAEYKITVKVEDDGQGGIKATATVSGSAALNALNFENSYKTADGVSAKVELGGKVTLTGKDLADGAFTFELYTTGANFAENGTPKTITNTNGKFAFTLNYTSADAGKTFYYVVKEANAGKVLNGITYSSTTYKITVRVEDDGKGGIKATATVSGSTALNALNFENSYKTAEGVSAKVELGGNVTLTGKDLTDGAFTFELYTANASFATSAKIKTATNANGKFAFTLDYAAADAGKTFYYVVKEVNAGKTIDGITYSATTYKITVKVEDDGKGGIKVTATADGSAELDSLDFANIYKVAENASAKVELGGKVTLTGKSLKNGAFTFELYTANAGFATSGSLKTATNKSGKYSFTLNYTAEDAGKTFYYVVKEKNAGKTIDGITYSSMAYKITVKVSEDGKGGITAKVTVNNNISEKSLNFENVYTVSSGATAGVILSGNTTFAGRDLTDGTFTFELYTADASFVENGAPKTATNIDGMFTFALSYTKDDAGKTFYYVVKEFNAGQTIDGVTYSADVYKITVKVESDGKGGIKTTATVDGDVALDALNFANAYKVTDDASASVVLGGNVTLTGKDLMDGEFTFELYGSDNSFTVNGTPKTTVNTNGAFSFTIDYTAADAGNTFYYVLKVASAGETVDGITYSSTTYNIIVTVADDGQGGLTATATVDGGGDIYALNFESSYEEPKKPDTPDNPVTPPENPGDGDDTNDKNDVSDKNDNKDKDNNTLWIVIVVIVLGVGVIGVAAFFIFRKKRA